MVPRGGIGVLLAIETLMVREADEPDELAPLRVLHVIGLLDPAYGGPVAALHGLTRGLEDLGHEVTIATTDRRFTPNGSMTIDREQATVLFPVRWPKSWNLSPPLWRWLHAAAGNYDIIEVHSVYGFHTIAAFCAARRAGVPVVIRPHGSLDIYHRHQKRLKKGLYERLVDFPMLRRADGIQCTTVHEREHVATAIGGPYNGFVSPLGADVVPTDRRPDPEAPVVLFLGRLTAKKQPDVLIRAFTFVIGKLPTARLRVIGPGDHDVVARCRTLIAQLGLGDHVTLVGPVYGDEKWREYELASLFVLPSLDESFGIGAMEAVAAGVPVLISNQVYGLDSLVQRGLVHVTGLDAEELAGRIIELLCDKDLERKAHSAALAAREEFSWTAAARYLADEYREIIERRNPEASMRPAP